MSNKRNVDPKILTVKEQEIMTMGIEDTKKMVERVMEYCVRGARGEQLKPEEMQEFVELQYRVSKLEKLFPEIK